MKSCIIIFLLCATVSFATSCGMFAGKSTAKKEHDGLFLIDDSVKDFYIDRTGKKVLDCPESGCSEFSEGIAVVSTTANNTKKFIDKTGKVLFQGDYLSVEPFSDGLAIVKVKDPSGGTNDKYGAIDKTGKMVVEAKYDDMKSFSDGMALVGRKPSELKIGELGLCPGDCKYGYVDKTGKLVIEPQYEIAQPFSEGYALVKKDAYSGNARFIDKTGKETDWHEKHKFSDALPFSEGFAAIKTSADGWVFIDAKGEKAFELKDGIKFDEVRGFSGGWAAVKLDVESGASDAQILRPWTFINSGGKLRSGLRFNEAGDFSEGLAAVKDGTKWIYIKPDDEDLAKKANYEKAEPFAGGVARVEIGTGAGAKKASIDTTGKVIWEEDKSGS
jgi:hypothetical protein